MVVSCGLFVGLGFFLLFCFGFFNINSKIDINTVLEIIAIFRYVKAVEGRTILKTNYFMGGDYGLVRYGMGLSVVHTEMGKDFMEVKR